MNRQDYITSACETQLHGLCKYPLYANDMLEACNCICHSEKIISILDNRTVENKIE